MNGNPKLPLYHHMMSDIIRNIESEEWPQGMKLPSEQELCDLFKVSRITVRKALEELEKKTYIEKKRGVGSFVLGSVSEQTSVLNVGVVHGIQRMGKVPSIVLNSFELVVDGSLPEISKKFKIADNEYLYVIEQTYYGNQKPLYFETNYLKFDRFPMIHLDELKNKELMPFLEKKYNLLDVELKQANSAGKIDFSDPKLHLVKGSSYTKIEYEAFENEQLVLYSEAKAVDKLPAFLINHNAQPTTRRRKNMGTPNILLTRIDNRLVHGQVGMTWTKTIGANLILVANDDVATDTLQQKLMKSTADAAGADIRFFTIEKTIEIIGKAADRQKIFIVVKTPKDARRLVEGGVPLEEVNVGNMHFSPGKIEVTKKVYVDESDKEDLQYLADKNITVYIQDVPGDKKVSVNFK